MLNLGTRARWGLEVFVFAYLSAPKILGSQKSDSNNNKIYDSYDI